MAAKVHLCDPPKNVLKNAVGDGAALVVNNNAVSGAVPGFQKGGGTPKNNGENANINDIHNPLDMFALTFKLL